MGSSSLFVAAVTIFSVLSSAVYCDIFVYNQNPPMIIEEEFRDMPAKFGPSLSSDGMRAFVVAAEPSNGCFTLKPPPPDSVPNFTGNWVVLISRRNCSFEDKVRNAQAAGFDGVIIYNVGSNDLDVMSAKNPMGIDIPSVFVGENDGSFIYYNYLYTNKYFLVINGDIPFNINKHLLLPFAIVIVLCLIIMIIFLTVRCVRERRRARRHRLPNSLLKKIPTCKFAKGDPYDMCAICLDDYVEGDKLRVLPCAHAYHCKCIDPWLTKNRRVCPVCKRKVIAVPKRTIHGNVTDTARSVHESHSDSDTDDDRAPLVNSNNDRPTQGGTFNRQRENPFMRAARIVSERNQSPTSASNLQSNSQCRNEQSDARIPQGGSWPESSRGGPFLTGVLNLRGERFSTPNQCDNESLNDDAQSSVGGDPSLASRSPSVRTHSERERNVRRTSNEGGSRRSRKNSQQLLNQSRRRGSNTTQVSSNSERSHPEVDVSSASNVCDDVEAQPDENSSDQGLIGVAALPNIHVADRQDRDRGNDYII